MRTRDYPVWMLPSVALILSGCGRDAIQARYEQIKRNLAGVLDPYQRRADPGPSPVGVVKDYAAHVSDVLARAAERPARVAAIKVTPQSSSEAAAFAGFQQTLRQTTSSLSRLLAVAENDPNFDANCRFRELPTPIEGAGNRVTRVRIRSAKAVPEDNTTVRPIPSDGNAMAFGFPAVPSK